MTEAKNNGLHKVLCGYVLWWNALWFLWFLQTNYLWRPKIQGKNSHLESEDKDIKSEEEEVKSKEKDKKPNEKSEKKSETNGKSSVNHHDYHPKKVDDLLAQFNFWINSRSF